MSTCRGRRGMGREGTGTKREREEEEQERAREVREREEGASSPLYSQAQLAVARQLWGGAYLAVAR